MKPMHFVECDMVYRADRHDYMCIYNVLLPGACIGCTTEGRQEEKIRSGGQGNGSGGGWNSRGEGGLLDYLTVSRAGVDQPRDDPAQDACVSTVKTS